MKKITVFKEYENVNLLHLYEHAFCNSLREYFYRNKLFGFIDYFISAKTYDYGYSEVLIEAYNNDIFKIIENINSLDLEIDKTKADSAFISMLAEERNHFGVANSSIDIYTEINKIHKFSWRNGRRRKIPSDILLADSLLLRENGRIKRKEYKMILSTYQAIDPKYSELFYYLSHALFYDSWFITTTSQGYYAYDPKILNTSLTAKAFVIDGVDVDISKNIKYTLDIINNIIKSDAVNRMSNILKNKKIQFSENDIKEIIYNFTLTLSFDGRSDNVNLKILQTR